MLCQRRGLRRFQVYILYTKILFSEQMGAMAPGPISARPLYRNDNGNDGGDCDDHAGHDDDSEVGDHLGTVGDTSLL